MKLLVLCVLLTLSGLAGALITVHMPFSPFACYFMLYSVLTLYVLENWTFYKDIESIHMPCTDNTAECEHNSKKFKFLVSTIKSLARENTELRNIMSYMATHDYNTPRKQSLKSWKSGGSL
jgi:hypothetical protein